MPTTLQEFAGARRRNYETLPTIDVEVLPDTRHCATCGAEVVYVPHPRGPGYGCGSWRHASPDAPGHYVAPATRCRYCHSHDDAVYKQHAWFDAVECSRCGGVDGHAIGD
jgi:hypothetical protein